VPVQYSYTSTPSVLVQGCTLLLFLMKLWTFLADFRKILEYQFSWNVFPVGAELLHAERWADGQTYQSFCSLYFLLRDLAKERVQDQAICLSLPESQTVIEVKDSVTNKSSHWHHHIVVATRANTFVIAP